MEFSHQVHHRLAALRIEISSGLVGEENQRLAGHGARYGDTLLLTARQLARQMLRAMRHADAFERRLHALAAFSAAHAAVGERQLHVLEDAQVANQVEALEDEANLPISDAGALGGAEVRHLPGIQRVGALRWRVEQPEDREQRRLAAARRSRDGDVLAALNCHVDARQRVRFDFVGQKDFRDPLQLDQWLHASSGSATAERYDKPWPRPRVPDPYFSRTLSNASHADMSERITLSPGCRPDTI